MIHKVLASSSLNALLSTNTHACLRCQLQQARRFLPPSTTLKSRIQFVRSGAWSHHYAFTTQATDAVPPPRRKKANDRHFVILELPGRRRGKEPVSAAPLNESALDALASTLLKYEDEVKTGNIASDIGLCKPSTKDLKVSRERFEQMAKELSSSFITLQLNDYLKSLDRRKMTRKADIIDFILREIWKVQVAEEIKAEEDLIMTEKMESSKIELFFLIKGSGKLLRDLSKKHETRITISLRDETITLSANTRNLRKVEKILRDMIGAITYQDMDLTPLLRVANFDESSFASIARLTNAYIEKTDDKTLRIHALGSRPGNFDDAKRLLFSSLPIQYRDSYSLLCDTGKDESLRGALYAVCEEDSLPWRYRGREWSRWRSIKRRSQPTKVEMLSEPNTPATPLQSVEDIKAFLDNEESGPVGEVVSVSSKNEEVKEIHSRVEYYSLIGNIIHSTPKTPPTDLTTFLLDSSQRVFCSALPHILSTLAIIPPASLKQTHSFVLHFSPSPWSNPTNFETLPQVELTLSVNTETGSSSQPRLRAIKTSKAADVMMPGQEADVRYVRKETIDLDPNTPAMLQFMENSDLNLLNNLKLKVEPNVVFHLPRFLVPVSSEVSTNTAPVDSMTTEESPELKENPLTSAIADPTPDTLNSPFLECSYIFASLEFHTHYHFTYNSLPLTYTRIEGGASGGHRNEVRIACVSYKPVPLPNLKDLANNAHASTVPFDPRPVEADVSDEVFADFVNKTGKLVEGLSGSYAEINSV